MKNTVDHFFDIASALKIITSFKLFGIYSSAIKLTNASIIFACQRFYARHNPKVKFIDKDISVTELKNIFDSDEYECVYIDTVSNMSNDCVEMIRNFVYVYEHDESDLKREMCVGILRHSKKYEGYNGRDILELKQKSSKCSCYGVYESLAVNSHFNF